MTQGSDRPPPFGPKLKSAWDWAISNADVTAAFVLGVGFGVLGLTKVIKGDALPEATLAVLSVLALALVRERRIREGVDKRLDDLGTAIHGLDQTVASLQAGGQYHVLEHQATWDIASDDGRLAYAHRHKRIKVDQDNVLAVLDYASRTGEEEVEYLVDGRRVPTKQVINVDARGRRYALVPLGRMYARNEELDFVVKRTLRDLLCDPVNSVAALTEDVTALLRMSVIWPAGRRPTALRLEQIAAASVLNQPLPLTLLQDEHGRPTLHFDVPQPERGGRTEISWDWPFAS